MVQTVKDEMKDFGESTHVPCVHVKDVSMQCIFQQAPHKDPTKIVHQDDGKDLQEENTFKILPHDKTMAVT